MKNIFKNKIFLTLLFSLIIISFYSSVFAYSETFTYNDLNYSFFVNDNCWNKIIELEEYKSGEYNYFIYTENQITHICFFKKSDNINLYLDMSGIGSSKCNFNGDLSSITGYIEYRINESGSGLSLYSSNATRFSWSNFYTTGRTLYMITNMDVYTDSSLTDFFFKAPQITVEPETKEILAETLEETLKAENPQKEIIQILPLIIVVVASLVGLRKALKMLLAVLHRS